MRIFWRFINLALVLALCGAGFFLYRNYEAFLGSAESGPLAVSHAASSRETPVDYPDTIRFRVKIDALCQEEAVLVEPGGPLKFTLRPMIELPSDASSRVAGWVSSMPGLPEKIVVDWKSEGGGELRSAGPGRYEFLPPAEGGDVILRFRGEYRIPQGAPVAGQLRGETSIRLICPIPWDALSPETQDLIGRYPTIGPNSGLAPYRDFYQRPSHFYKVDESNERYKISPHFRLGDFDLHFDYNDPTVSTPINGLPQYIALDSRLVVKLEQILSGLQEKGIDIDTLGILAGFRSPSYNAWKKEQGGVGGKYTKGVSTHLFGGAADFYVDADGDGVMDDLNGDGKIDQEDSAWVREQIVDHVDCQAQASNSGLAGMCGIYGEHDIPDRPIQSPNLHVDIRGYSLNRWYINPRDEMVTDWQYWTRNDCNEILSASR
jgi:hypothetical protein